MLSDEGNARTDYNETLDETALLERERDAPRDVDLLVLIGKYYFKQLELTKCHKYYLRALKIDPDDGWTHLYMGNLCYGVSCYDEAQTHFERAIELLPDVPCAHWCLGDLYREMGYWTRTEQSYRRAIEIAPTDTKSKQKLDEWLAYRLEQGSHIE